MQAPEPDVQTIRLHKSNNGMGLSIVAAKVSYCVLYDPQFRMVLIVFVSPFFPGCWSRTIRNLHKIRSERRRCGCGKCNK